MSDKSRQPLNNAENTYLKSMFYAQLVEHVFVSEVLQEVWYVFGQTVEVLRSEVDSSGYDVVFDCNGIVRHVQLKTSKANAKASSQKVNVALANKPSGCIVWIVRHEDRQPCRIELSYRFFGGNAGKPLPSLKEFKVAKHTKGNAKGEKKKRVAIRVVPKSQFMKIKTTRELVRKLFGLREPANKEAIRQVEEATAESEADDA